MATASSRRGTWWRSCAWWAAVPGPAAPGGEGRWRRSRGELRLQLPPQLRRAAVVAQGPDAEPAEVVLDHEVRFQSQRALVVEVELVPTGARAAAVGRALPGHPGRLGAVVPGGAGRDAGQDAR